VSVDPAVLEITFKTMASLLGDATARKVAIDEHAVPVLQASVTSLIATHGQLSPAALHSWQTLVNEKSGQVLAMNDIWEWIRKFFPDPVTAEVGYIVTDERAESGLR
jgi:hypothetical protein